VGGRFYKQLQALEKHPWYQANLYVSVSWSHGNKRETPPSVKSLGLCTPQLNVPL
jgi:hypothetical protein